MTRRSSWPNSAGEERDRIDLEFRSVEPLHVTRLMAHVRRKIKTVEGRGIQRQRDRPPLAEVDALDLAYDVSRAAFDVSHET